MLFVFHSNGFSQGNLDNFRSHQFTSHRVVEANDKYSHSSEEAFVRARLAWPPSDIYLRAFKSQNELELWGRNNSDEEYRKVKTFRVCAVSGTLGPKRRQGDKQIPEGFYFIEEFNNNSEYHLSMLLNYPNYSDRAQNGSNPGGNIYIHGGCLTVGCLPMSDEGISELYTVCLSARLNGQTFIPVHVYPTRMTGRGIAYLIQQYGTDTSKQQFWAYLKNGYEYFERNHKLLPVIYTPEGNYAN